MLFSIKQQAASALGLAMAVSSAPLNERTKHNLLERDAGLGWLCHFDGPIVPSVDASLNLPLMLGGLCAKVNYDYDGCDSFKSLNGDGSSPVKTQSIPQDYDSNEDPNAVAEANHGNPHGKPKHKGNRPNGSVNAQSFNSADGNPDGESTSPNSHRKKPKHHGSDSDGTVGAQSFNSADDDDKPRKSHPSSVNALGDEDADNSEGCDDDEYFSSEAGRCVNKGSFSKPNSDSTCKNGKLDAVLKLCLDVSVLGLKPIHAEVTVLPSRPPRNGKDACPLGQQLSSLLNVCVDQKFFSSPLTDNQCQQGWKLDLVLGSCLDIVGCQNKA